MSENCQVCPVQRLRFSPIAAIGAYNRRYLACQISAIKFVPAIFYVSCCESPVKPTHPVWRFYHTSFQNCHIASLGEKKSPGVSASIATENRKRFSLAIKFAAVGVQNRQVCRWLKRQTRLTPGERVTTTRKRWVLINEFLFFFALKTVNLHETNV